MSPHEDPMGVAVATRPFRCERLRGGTPGGPGIASPGPGRRTARLAAARRLAARRQGGVGPDQRGGRTGRGVACPPRQQPAPPVVVGTGGPDANRSRAPRPRVAPPAGRGGLLGQRSGGARKTPPRPTAMRAQPSASAPRGRVHGAPRPLPLSCLAAVCRPGRGRDRPFPVGAGGRAARGAGSRGRAHRTAGRRSGRDRPGRDPEQTRARGR